MTRALRPGSRDTTLPVLERDGEIFVLDLGAGDNVLRPVWVERVRAAVEQVADTRGPRALVTTASGRVWASGLDLDHMDRYPTQTPALLRSVHDLLATLLVAPFPTVAAICGHVFAAGAMLALAHDHRVMSDGRGYFCLPEIQMGIVLTTGMTRLVAARLPPHTHHEAITTGRRYEPPAAFAAGVVQELVAPDDVVGRAMEVARSRPELAGPELGAAKQALYADVVRGLQASAAQRVTNEHFARAFEWLEVTRAGAARSPQ